MVWVELCMAASISLEVNDIHHHVGLHRALTCLSYIQFSQKKEKKKKKMKAKDKILPLITSPAIFTL